MTRALSFYDLAQQFKTLSPQERHRLTAAAWGKLSDRDRLAIDAEVARLVPLFKGRSLSSGGLRELLASLGRFWCAEGVDVAGVSE